MQPWRISQVATLLAGGGVIAYPTEGVWGLGCLPFAEDAVERILTLKGRSAGKGLILVAGALDEFSPVVDRLTEDQRSRIEASLGRHVTWLVPDQGWFPDWITGGSGRVAIRLSEHPFIQAICHRIGGPLVSTSANPAGRTPARTAFRVRQYFPRGIDQVIPGCLGDAAGASEIRDLVSGRVLRAGAQELADA